MRILDEKEVWELLIRKLPWRPEPHTAVQIHLPGRRKIRKTTSFQLFEVAFATVLSRMCPEYAWSVTPQGGDGGIDFLGRTPLFLSEPLGIAAYVTIGGQCKKRERVDNVVNTVAGSLVNMGGSPTFYIVALAANVSADRIADAREKLESRLQRDCHILQRRQIEALFLVHIDALRPLLELALATDEVQGVVAYLNRRSSDATGIYEMVTDPPAKVLAGQPFEFSCQVRGLIQTSEPLRIRWKRASPPSDERAATADGMALIGPLGGDRERGVAVASAGGHDDDPLAARVDLQFVNYATGRRNLGVIELFVEGGDGRRVLAERVLGDVTVIENARPRFFAEPVREVAAGLESSWDATTAGATETAVVVGTGGAGKSRVIEEFALEIRRRGARAVSAEQAKNLEYPRRLLANLLVGLADPDRNGSSLSDGVIARIAVFDPALATSATGTIKGMLDSAGKGADGMDDEKLVAVIVVLIRTILRHRPLCIHLQDLHWCTADVLELLDRIVWELEQHRTAAARNGVLFVFEGRVGEEFARAGWSTRTFEAWMHRLGKPVHRCRAFTDAESEIFARRLFESGDSAQRRTPDALLELQRSVAADIHRAASGNPFHMLEQVKLLKNKGAIAQNPETGLYYLVRPGAVDRSLPDTVAGAIQARWRYLLAENPGLAHLIWAVALLSERVPAALFQHLWSSLAPGVSLGELEATEFLNVSSTRNAPVVLRHENYFQTLREITLPPATRTEILTTYLRWYSEIPQPTAQQLLDFARLELFVAGPDLERVADLLGRARHQAYATGDRRLLRRVLEMLVDDVYGARQDLFVATESAFLAACTDEVELCGTMVVLGERDEALRRLDALDRQITERAEGGDDSLLSAKRYEVRITAVGVLMNNRNPAAAALRSGEAVADLELRRSAGLDTTSARWRQIELDLYHVHSVALALAGELYRAREAGKHAVDVASSELVNRERALDAISTYANILTVSDPDEAERLLRTTREQAASLSQDSQLWTHVNLNLAMSLIVLAHRDGNSREREPRLTEATGLLRPLFTRMIEQGRSGEAGAAALLIGLVHAILDQEEEITWFANAVAAAARGRQMETLWRAHINLATSMHRRGHPVELVREHARAAYEILMHTLSPYDQPERSHRFTLVRVPLAHAVRFLIEAGDPVGERALVEIPALEACFDDLHPFGRLRPDRGGYSSREWLCEGEYDYVLY